MYAKILQGLLQRFFVTMGRAPMTPNEWSKLRRQAMELARKEEGIPSVTSKTTLEDLMAGPHISEGPKGQRMWDFSKDLPTRDVLEKSADIIPFPKGRSTSRGVMGLMQKGDVTVGTAGKTTPEHLKAKKDRGILLRDADEDILRIKRENKEAVDRFREKFSKIKPHDEFAGGGIARAGFPFGGKALKAIRDAWRANKTWGVGGPPYKPEKTSFNIKEMTKRNLGEELSLSDLRKLSESPLAGPQKGHFEDFNREFKNIKASILKEKLRESKIHAEAMIDSAEHTIKNANQEFNKAFGPLRDKKKQQDMAKKISDQFTREGKKQLAEAKEGLKEIDIYMGMLQKKGRSVHYAGGIAPLVGEPSYAADFYDDRTPYATGEIVEEENFIKGPDYPVEIGPLKIKPRAEVIEGEQTEQRIGSPIIDKEIGSTDIGADMTLDIGKGIYGIGKYDKGRTSEDIYFEGEKVMEKVPRDHDIWKYGIGYGDEGMRAEVIYDPDTERYEFKIVKSFNKGGRIGYAKGKTFRSPLYPVEEEEGKPHASYEGQRDALKRKMSRIMEGWKTRDIRDMFKEYSNQGKAQGGRIGLAGGGALFKFIEKLFIKASNDIRLGRGKWKGLDQKQRMVQHDNLTKKVTEFQKSGNTEGLEIYFDVNPNEAFKAAEKKALLKKYQDETGLKTSYGDKHSIPGDEGIMDAVRKGKAQRAEIEAQRQEQIMEEAYEEIRGGSGFSGDYKYDADILADSLATVQGKVYADLPDLERTGIYDQALKRVQQDLKTRIDAKKAFKDLDQKIELQMFDTKDRLPNQSGGPVDQEALIQMYIAEGLSYEEAVQAAQSAANLPWDTLKKAEGGRADFIFGGSAGLRALLKRLKGGRKRIFPSPPQGIKKFMGKADTDYIDDLKLQQLETILKAAKIDKDMIAQIAKNKKMADPGLDFLMGKMDEIGLMPKNISKYTDVDKDIMDIEMMIKNYSDKKLKRKPHNLGGRIEYSGGGRAGLPAITYGTPQLNMQGPQMPAGPQPAGIPGGTIVAQKQMQQAPWMGPQMQQGMGGMPRPMAAGGGRIGFSVGGFDKARRAFLKMLAGITAGGVAAGTGLLKLGKAAKVAPKVTEAAEVITRGADGMPSYIYDLIEVVKAKGTRDVIEGFKRNDYSTVHSYKGVDVIEHPSGAIKIKKGQEKPMYGSDEPSYHEVEMEISPQYREQVDPDSGLSWYKDADGKKVYEQKIPDEYAEYTAKPDMDGKLKDIDEYIDDADHLELQKIADEGSFLTQKRNRDKVIKTKKASGGLAYALGE